MCIRDRYIYYVIFLPCTRNVHVYVLVRQWQLNTCHQEREGEEEEEKRERERERSACEQQQNQKNHGGKALITVQYPKPTDKGFSTFPLLTFIDTGHTMHCSHPLYHSSTIPQHTILYRSTIPQHYTTALYHKHMPKVSQYKVENKIRVHGVDLLL